MAVAKMEMINIIGHLDYLDEVCKRIVLSESIHMLNAINEINENNFPIMNVEDINAIANINYIRPYNLRNDYKEIEKKFNSITDIFGTKKKIKLEHFKEEYKFKEEENFINNLYEMIKEKSEEYENLKREEAELDNLITYIIHLKDLNFKINDILNMEFIDFKIGKINKYDLQKVKKNYENIPGIVLKINQNPDYSFILIFYPKAVENEMIKILNSINFEEFKIKFKFEGTPKDWLAEIEKRKQEIEKRINELTDDISEIKEANFERIEKFYSRLVMENRMEEVKQNIAVTNEFFYLSGWVPAVFKRRVKRSLEDLEEKLIIIYKPIKEIREGLAPPTYLKNGYLLRPFESIVKLYGIPSYNELDPTSFVGISYMLLFGAMFGDVGQGLVLFLIGEFLNRRKRRPNLGGVLARLGISSTFFGFIYGSIFGFEDALKTYVVKPMIEIEKMLIYAIAFGVILLSVGFIYNLVNCFRNKDIEEGLFSRNGVAGLAFYWLLLYYIIVKVENITPIISSGAILFLLIFNLLLIFFKEPLANLIKGEKRLYRHSAKDYYIEEGFGILETLLSILSNTLSFIRVGAFAINHVGLFIAFETLAEMIRNGVASALMLVLGNLVIIGLEGLIVFIQGLRLEYYELFSKFFKGNGYEYTPISIRG